eukprot:11171311-Karenia_brevis.AAC.1
MDEKFAVRPLSAAANYYLAGQHTKTFHRDSHATDMAPGIVAIRSFFGAPRQLESFDAHRKCIGMT